MDLGCYVHELRASCPFPEVVPLTLALPFSPRMQDRDFRTSRHPTDYGFLTFCMESLEAHVKLIFPPLQPPTSYLWDALTVGPPHFVATCFPYLPVALSTGDP